jgi:hypothetical protein
MWNFGAISLSNLEWLFYARPELPGICVYGGLMPGQKDK